MLWEARRREICEKIERWRSWSAFNEEATIQGIVMPVLEVAGYNVRDPEQVFPQARDSAGGVADLKLYKGSALAGDTERFIIEVKSLGAKIDANHLRQVKSYFRANVRWYILTNGYEWYFLDPEYKGNEHFVRLHVSLEMPGALDALCWLLDRARNAPNFDCAIQTLIEARLREVARSLSWEQHRTLWEHSENRLAVGLRTAIQEAHRDYPEQAGYIRQWEDAFKNLVERGEAPDWWHQSPLPSKETSEPTLAGSSPVIPSLPAEAVPIKELRKKDLSNTSPRRLFLGGAEIDLGGAKWARVLMAILQALDERNCLPKAPYPPNKTGTGLLYDYQEHPDWERHARESFESKQFNRRIYVNKHGSSAHIARRIYMLLSDANCPNMTPDTIYVVYELSRK